MAMLLITGSVIQVSGQGFTTVSLSDQKAGSEVKGIYLLESGVNTGLYLKEQNDGSITVAALDAGDEHFYFWVSENTETRTFQIHSASSPGMVVLLNTDGSASLTDDLDAEESNFLFRMDESGPVRSNADTESIAIGILSTQKLDEYEGSADCEC